MDPHFPYPKDGGLGGPIRLMLDDAGVFYVFNYIEYYEEFPNKVKPRWIEEGHPFDCAPMIELYEKRYSGTQPILRFLSKKLSKLILIASNVGYTVIEQYVPFVYVDNKYTPDDLDLEQYVDATTDYAADWIQAYFNAAYRTVMWLCCHYNLCKDVY